MKTRIRLAFLASLVVILHEAAAQDTAFTYQGLLTANGVAVNGPAEVQFTLWDSESGGTMPLASNTPMVLSLTATNGQFTAPLDFGAAPFDGSDRWVQVELRTTLGPFTPLTPRQKVTPMPYAIRAAHLTGAVASNSLSGTYGNSVTFNNAANSFSGNGAGLTTLNASRLSSGTVPNARLPAIVARTNEVWLLGGNVGANPTNNFIGTADNEPLEIRANGRRALRIEWSGDSTTDFGTEDDGSVNLLGGAPTNSIAPGVVGSFIGGGGAATLTYDSTGGPHSITAPNRVSGDYDVIGGGAGNTASNSFSIVSGGTFNAASGYGTTVAGGSGNTARGAVSSIGGGGGNTVGSGADSATIAGGGQNTIYIGSSSSTIGGGRQNSIHTNATDSTIGGGAVNRIQSYVATGKTTTGATISGGVLNTIGPGADYATIAGGLYNVAAGEFSFAAGQQAEALHNGTFVWAGGATRPYATTITSSFNVYAAGGMSFDYAAQSDAAPRGARWVYIGPLNAGNTISTWNGARLTDGGVWSNASDRKRKQDFAEVNPLAVLEKVAALPVRAWRYTNEAAGVRHLGPTAQDFKAAFGLGTDDESIGTVDADGVALAAIQGLNQKLEQTVAEKDSKISALEKRLAELEKYVPSLAAQTETSTK